MKVLILGAGFTGLTAGLRLAKQGHKVLILEKEKQPAGLASGFKEEKWQWWLDKYYHHLFRNDQTAITLGKEVNQPFAIKRPKTSVFLNNSIEQLDSPSSLLSSRFLNFREKLGMGFSLLFLKINPFWRPLENISASKILPLTMTKSGFKKIWEPLFINKFSDFHHDVPVSWFWARIKKRTAQLVYPEGGFVEFAKKLVTEIEKNEGVVKFESEVLEIEEGKIKTRENGKEKIYSFNKCIVTFPLPVFIKLSPTLPSFYKNRYSKIKSLSTHNLILRLNKPFFKDNTYWLNISDKKSPITAIVEHTNFIDKKFYNKEVILYLGNYLKKEDKRFNMTGNELLNIYDPYLKKINKDYRKSLIGYKLFKDLYAQPIVFPKYSKNVPPHKTPFKNIHLACIEQVYPWDRGINYAIELGEKIAEDIS